MAFTNIMLPYAMPEAIRKRRNFCRLRQEVFMPDDREIDEVIRMLDSKTLEGVSRIGIHRVETEREDFVKEVHHHGRCDVGSPFASADLCNLTVNED